MTRATNARIAGITLLVYIAAVITSMVLFRRAAGGEGVAAKLAGIAAHASDAGTLVILGLVQCFSAIVLAVTFYAITRDEDADLAALGPTCFGTTWPSRRRSSRWAAPPSPTSSSAAG